MPAAQATPSTPNALQQPFWKGMTLSCPTWGPIWGTPANAAALDELQELGVEWVAYHPYARIHQEGRVSFSPTTETSFLQRAVDMSRSRRLHVMWKPHLAYWGSGFSWRGAIDFGDDEQKWRTFFKTYTAFIVDQAQFAERNQLPVFVMGVELDATMHRAEWRHVVQAVRQVYSGVVTYAANWDAAERNPLWPHLDVIGIQAYYPLVDGATSPTDAQLRSAWAPVGQRLKALSTTTGKKVVFTEVGYAASKSAASEPWKPDVDDDARSLRAQLTRVVLEEMPKADFLVGAFFWKWIPGAAPFDRDFSMKDAEMKSTLKAAWSSDAE